MNKIMMAVLQALQDERDRQAADAAEHAVEHEAVDATDGGSP